MKEQLLGVLEEIRPDLDWEAEKQLIDGGVLDSFDIVSIVGALNDEFDIDRIKHAPVDELLFRLPVDVGSDFFKYSK